MKKNSVLLSGILVLFAFMGCSESSDSQITYAAPEVLAAEDLPDSNATVGTQDDSRDIFIEALESLNTNVIELSEDQSPESSIATRSRATEEFPIYISDSFGGGTITCNGKITTTYSSPSEDWIPEPDTWYNDLLVMEMTGSIEGTVDGCTIPADNQEYTYLVDGETKEKLYMDMDLDFYYDEELSDFNIDLYTAVAFGASYSLRRSDTGVGGKFVLTYSSTIDKNDISTDYLYVDPDYLYNELANKIAQLKVYNDANELQYTIDIPLNEIPSVIDSVMNSDTDYP